MTATGKDNNEFSAEELLADSSALEQVYGLRDKLSRGSDGVIVDYDDMAHRIAAEVDELPVLELQQDITPGTEGAYQRQLLHALEKINDDHDRVFRKVLKLKSRLVNAINLMKVQRSQFSAYYSLAINAYVATLPNPKMLKLTAAGIKEMAAGEYSRLMDSLDLAAPSLISELEILEIEIKGRKSAQSAKYSLGKDQVNAMWTSFQSSGGGISIDDDPNALLKKFPVEEDGDDIPSFVSRHSKEVRVAASSSLLQPPSNLCSVCGEKQIDSPSGVTCINGHGGAPGGNLSKEAIAEIAAEPDIKGIFVKTGDPKPITPILEDGGDAVVIRKPRIISMPDWSKERLMELAKAEDEAGGVLIGRPEPMKQVEVKLDTPVEYVSVTVTVEDAKPEEPIEVKEYRPKFNLDEVTDSLVNPTKKVLIEDIPDYPKDATLSEALEISNFKPVSTTRIVLPEGAVPVDDIDVLNDPDPLATVAPTTPRKKLMLLDEDEL